MTYWVDSDANGASVGVGDASEEAVLQVEQDGWLMEVVEAHHVRTSVLGCESVLQQHRGLLHSSWTERLVRWVHNVTHKRWIDRRQTYVDFADGAGLGLLVGIFLGRVALDHHLDGCLAHDMALGDGGLHPAHVRIGHIDLAVGKCLFSHHGWPLA